MTHPKPGDIVALKSNPELLGYFVGYDETDTSLCKVAYWCSDPDISDILEFKVPRKALTIGEPVACNREGIETGDVLVFPSNENPQQVFTSLKNTSLEDSVTIPVAWFTSKGVFKQKDLPLILLVPLRKQSN